MSKPSAVRPIEIGPITLTAIPPQKRDDGGRYDAMRVEMHGTAPKMKGFSFLAKIDHKEAGASGLSLVFGVLRPRQGAVVQALGDDPTTGRARYCTTLKFDFRGEWRVPQLGHAQIVETGPTAASHF